MRKYDLARMIEEIRREEGGAPVPEKKKVLTQEQIKAMSQARRKVRAGKTAAK